MQRYKEEPGAILVGSIQGKGSLAPGLYHVHIEHSEETPEGWYVKLVVANGTHKGAVQKTILGKDIIRSPLNNTDVFELEVGLTDGVVLGQTASGYTVHTYPQKEMLTPKPVPMASVIAILKANPELSVSSPVIKRLEKYDGILQISKETEANPTDTNPSDI